MSEPTPRPYTLIAEVTYRCPLACPYCSNPLDLKAHAEAGELTTEALPLSNCAGVWSCAFENWGIMQGPRKLEARSWDTGYHCYDVEADPYERNPAEDCSDLLQVAQKQFGRLPGKER